MNKTISANVPASIPSKNILYYFHRLVGIALMFGFGMLHPFGGITQLGMQVLGVFLGLIYMWSFVWVEPADIIKYGLTIILTTFTIFLFVGLPLSRLIF